MAAPRAFCHCHSLTVRSLAFGFAILYNFAVWLLFCPGAKGKRHNRNSVPTLEYSTFKNGSDKGTRRPGAKARIINFNTTYSYPDLNPG